MKHRHWQYLGLSAVGLMSLSQLGKADDGYGPVGTQHAPSAYQSPKDLVPGGAWIDHILPIPVLKPLRSDTWGGENVKPRVVENGLEDSAWSYWCMSVHKEADGKYHLFATRWPEGDPRGHNAWPASEVVHTVAETPLGPYVVKDVVGPGHNVMAYRPKDGSYMLYVINGAYHAKSVNGPWAKYPLQYDTRGTKGVAMSNHTYVSREDGSVLMVSRGGHVWISEDGLKPFRKITNESFYPKIPGQFEDPVVWKDANQYHCIVNDWHGRTAFYLRSGNGVDWVWDQGKAYDVEIVKHSDGSREGWHKFERPNVLQDAQGRATHLFLAVMDAPKDLDKGKDNHSSKVLSLPLRVEKRMAFASQHVHDPKSKTVEIQVFAEEGFDPMKDLESSKIKFGPPAEVNVGRGGRCLGMKSQGKDAILTFENSGSYPEFEPCGKLLGVSRSGEIIHGYAKLPAHVSTALLSPLPPVVQASGDLSVVIENFGIEKTTASEASVMITRADGQSQTHQVSIPPLAPYAQAKVSTTLDAAWLKDQKQFKVTIAPKLPSLKASYEVPVTE